MSHSLRWANKSSACKDKLWGTPQCVPGLSRDCRHYWSFRHPKIHPASHVSYASLLWVSCLSYQTSESPCSHLLLQPLSMGQQDLGTSQLKTNHLSDQTHSFSYHTATQGPMLAQRRGQHPWGRKKGITTSFGGTQSHRLHHHCPDLQSLL